MGQFFLLLQFSKNSKIQKLLKIEVGGLKIAKISGKSRFFDHPLFQRLFACEKKYKKSRTTGASSNYAGRVGGLAEAAGKVRKGNPSGTGDLTHPSRTTQHPVGVRRI